MSKWYAFCPLGDELLKTSFGRRRDGNRVAHLHSFSYPWFHKGIKIGFGLRASIETLCVSHLGLQDIASRITGSAALRLCTSSPTILRPLSRVGIRLAGRLECARMT